MRNIRVLVGVLVRLVLVLGVLAVIGAVATAVVRHRRTDEVNSFDQWPEVPVNPAADQAA
jgi:hypothetical protein